MTQHRGEESRRAELLLLLPASFTCQLEAAVRATAAADIVRDNDCPFLYEPPGLPASSGI